VDILAESAVRITVLSLGAALVLRLLKIQSPRLIHRAWTAVMVVMLMLPVIVVSGPQFAVPLLPSQTNAFSTAATVEVAQPGNRSSRTGAPAASSSTAGDEGGVSWRTVALIVYCAGVGLSLLRLVIGLRHARAIPRDAVIAHGRLTHPSCITPMTVGLFAPAVILPADWTDWDAAELSAVLAHEDEHARRRDPLVAAMALLNRTIFWFHPLAWWLHRELTRLSEQACDAVVIAGGHDRDVYSACLVRFARRAAAAGGRIAPTAMAMPGTGLRARLRMLALPQAGRPSGSRVLGAVVAGAALSIICATAVPTAAPAQSGPGLTAATWRVDTSEHFEVVHAGLQADRVSAAIRDAEAAYDQLSAALKYDMPRRVLLVLVPRDRDVDAAAAPKSGIATSDGNTSAQRVVLSLESLDRRDGLVVHELTHRFAFDIIPATSRLSPFLIEGLAEHQRGTWDAQELRMIRNEVAAGAIPSVVGLGPTDRHWAHAVFDFVAAQNGAEGVRRLLFALRAQETLTQAVPMALDVTPDQFDRTFRGYVTTRFGL